MMPGDTKPRPDTKTPYDIKVNGVQMSLDHRVLSAREILTLAQKAGAVPGNPEDYLLQGEKRIYQLDDKIDIAEDSLFITIPNKPTPVACPTATWRPSGTDPSQFGV